MSMQQVAATRALARLFSALEDETRLRIVALLAHRELCVCHIQELLSLSQSNVSRHLRVLRLAGIVSDRREGRWAHYQLADRLDPELSAVLVPLRRTFLRDRALARRVRAMVDKAGPSACKP